MGSCYEHSLEKQNKKMEGLRNYKRILSVLDRQLDPFEEAIELRRIYSTYKDFMQAFYTRRKKNADKTARLVLIIDEFAEHKENLDEIAKLYKKYEEEGFFKRALLEEKFLIKSAGNLDSRFVINEFIQCDFSYDLDKFLRYLGISEAIFNSCIVRVKSNDPELYTKYINKVNTNKIQRCTIPETIIVSIYNGIITGKTLENKEFDELEFYRLLPFKKDSIVSKDKYFEREVYAMYKDTDQLDKLRKFKMLQQEYHKNISCNRGCTYSENLYIFSILVLGSKEKADVIRDYMEEINFRCMTPIFRASTINSYDEEDTQGKGITRSEVEAIFDSMEELRLPQYREVFNRLVKDKITSKSIPKKLKLEENE